MKALLGQVFQEISSASLLGVDFGSAYLKAVELVRSGDQLFLRRCSLLEVSGGNSVEGLKRFLAESPHRSVRAVVGISSPEAVVKPFRFSHLSRKELKAAVKLEAEQAILNGHALNDMAVDWHLFRSGSLETVNGICAVVPKKDLSSRLEKIRAAGLRPVVMDVEGLALWNAYWVLQGKRERLPGAVLLVNVGAKMTNLVVARSPEELILLRDFQFGSQALAQGLSKEWVAEVRDSIRYARAKDSHWELSAAYLTGGGSSAVNLTLLSKMIGVQTTVWNPLDHLRSDQPKELAVKHSAGPLFGVAIGLALRGEE